MKVSKEILKIVIIQYLDVDNDITSECKIIVLPCRDEETAKQFKEFYRNKFPPTQIMGINIIDVNIYG